MFEEAKKIELSDSERGAFKKLGNSADFQIAKKAIDNYMLRLNAGYLSGSETEEGAAAKEFQKLRNFIYYWEKIIQLTKHED